MATLVHVLGSPLSPFVRKVLVTLDVKGIPYEIDPLVPFYGDERFAALSPLRRVPVLRDDRVTLADSSVICQYLEDRHPAPSIYPADIADRARARWFEEFADTRLTDILIWRLWYEAVLKPGVWQQPRDIAAIERCIAEDIPPVLDYLEHELPEQGFLFGALSIADIAIAACFRNAALARFTPDAARWPRIAAYLPRVAALEPFRKLEPIESRLLRTPVPQQRALLAELGMTVAADTLATDRPRSWESRLS
jgi:glutathione S-transferase